MSVKNWIQNNMHQYTKEKRKAFFEECSKKNNCSLEYARVALYRYGKINNTQPKSSKKQVVQHNKNIPFLTDKEISERHDIYYKIRQAAQTLREGQYIEDIYFKECLVKVPTNIYRRPSDNSEFDKYKGKAGGKTYWGHPESINQKKQEGVLK